MIQRHSYYDYHDIASSLKDEDPKYLERLDGWRSDVLDGQGCNGFLTWLDYEEFDDEDDDDGRLQGQKELFEKLLSMGMEEESMGGFRVHVWW